MSETISDLAKSYEEAASTILDEKDLKAEELSNEQVFKEELEGNLLELEDNILYDEISDSENGIIDEVFSHLLEQEVITEKQHIKLAR